MVSGEADPPNPCHILEKLSPSRRSTKNEVAPGKSTAAQIFNQGVNFTCLPGDNFEFRALDRPLAKDDTSRTVNSARNVVRVSRKVLSYTRKASKLRVLRPEFYLHNIQNSVSVSHNKYNASPLTYHTINIAQGINRCLF